MVSEHSPIPQGGILGVWHLADTSDSSGGGNTLTNNSSVTFVPGKFGLGANCNGTNWLNNTGGLGVTTGDITLMGWLKLNVEPASGYYNLIQQSSNTNRYIMITYDNTTLKGVEDGTTTDYTKTLGTSQRYHVAFGRDGSGTYLWLNGALVKTGSRGSIGAGETNFVIGGENNSGANKANAIFDEVVAYGRTLTSAEIATYYRNCLRRTVFIP